MPEPKIVDKISEDAASLGAPTFDLKAPVVEVTVLEDRAHVVRRGAVDLRGDVRRQPDHEQQRAELHEQIEGQAEGAARELRDAQVERDGAAWPRQDGRDGDTGGADRESRVRGADR